MAKATKKKRRTGAVATKRLGAAKPAESAVVVEAAVKSPKKQGKRSTARSKPILVQTSAAEMPVTVDRLVRLMAAVQAVGTGEKKSIRTKKLLDSGIPKMAQKVVEEAAETAIDAVRGARVGLINESADLLFNLVVLWSALDVAPADVWAEMDRREASLGLAEKLPKPLD